MKCVLPGSNVKVLGRAVQSLAKFGEDIHLAALPEGLSLRAVNSCRSAYASFLLSHLCFLHYEHRRRGDGGRLRGDRSQGDDGAEEIFRCRISVKAMLSVFRATGSLDKAVEQCRILLNPNTCRLIIQMRCFRGITTTRHLCFSDGENVEASFSKSSSINELRAPARLLSDALVHFHGFHEEVCLTASATHVTLSNVPDESIDIAKSTRTNLALSVDEFESVRLRGCTELTFCLKETKGMLLFAESSNYPVSIHFDSPGRPIIFSLQDSVLEADFVLATQSEVAQSQQYSGRRCHEDVDGFDDMDSFMLAMDTTHVEEGGAGAATTSTEEPGRKKLRALLFEAPNQLPLAQDVLAEDSEPE